MKIFLKDQTPNFKYHLGRLKKCSVIPYEISKLKESKSTIELKSTKGINPFGTSLLFDYKIFPKNIMVFLTEWGPENRKMKIGDTIVQQVFLPPTKIFSQKIVFGVRIKEIIDEAAKKGFSYETLDGHVEKGISTFCLEQKDERLQFTIHTFSSPGNILTKLLGPIFSVPYQSYCTQKALQHVKAQFENYGE